MINKNTILLYVTGFILILIAGFRPIGIDRDSINYISIISVNIAVANFIDKEPGFWLIKYINDIAFNGNFRTFFLMFAIMGVSLKIFAIKKYSLTITLSVFAYICLYFILHEMTQIRVGVSAGIFLIALEDIKNKRLKAYLIKMIFAMMFHYSAILMLLVYFINPYKINLKLFFLLPILGILFAIIKDSNLNIFLNILNILPEFISNKIKFYIQLQKDNKYSDINILNLYYLSLIIIYYFSLSNYKKMKSEYDLIFIKILGITLFSFYFFSFLPVLAFRVSEFFGIVLIFLIPHISLSIKEKTIVNFLIITWLFNYFIFIMIMKNLNL